MAAHSSILASRIPWTEEPGRLQSIGSQGWTQLKQLSTHTKVLSALEQLTLLPFFFFLLSSELENKIALEPVALSLSSWISRYCVTETSCPHWALFESLTHRMYEQNKMVVDGCYTSFKYFEREREWTHSVLSDSVTPWTVAYQALPSMEFSKEEYWSGLPFPSPGDLPHPVIEPGSPALQADALPSEPPGKYFTLPKLPVNSENVYVCSLIS